MKKILRLGFGPVAAEGGTGRDTVDLLTNPKRQEEVA